MSITKVLLESPAGQRAMAELERKTVARTEAKAARENTQENIQMLLAASFGSVKESLLNQLRSIKNRKTLGKLFMVAATCTSL